MVLLAQRPVEVKPGHIKGNLFAVSGAGKTWLALSFPAPYYIDTEGGAKRTHYMQRLERAGGAYLGPDKGSCDFETIADQIRTLATTQHPYKTLVIDSITKVFQTRIAKESERLGKDDVYGASKKPAIKEMRRLISLIDRLDMNVWFIAHETAEWQSVNGQRQEIGRTADIWEKLIYELDLTLRLEKHGDGYRTATVHKTRLLGFPDGERFDIQKNGEDLSYSAIVERYGREAIEAEPVPVQLVETAMVSEIRRLLETVRVTEEEVDRILSKAKAEKVEDLSREHGEKMLAWLKGKVSKNGGEK
jgi:hypothetical protein